MIKTIKVKKQLRLDELIKYAFDNDVKDTRFESSNGSVIYFDEQGGFTLGEIFSVKKTSTFTVEVEEQINKDTRTTKTATLRKNEEVLRSWNNYINGLKKAYPDALQIHAIVNGKLQLIWEAE